MFVLSWVRFHRLQQIITTTALVIRIPIVLNERLHDVPETIKI